MFTCRPYKFHGMNSVTYVSTSTMQSDSCLLLPTLPMWYEGITHSLDITPLSEIFETFYLSFPFQISLNIKKMISIRYYVNYV